VTRKSLAGFCDGETEFLDSTGDTLMASKALKSPSPDCGLPLLSSTLEIWQYGAYDLPAAYYNRFDVEQITRPGTPYVVGA
jgi:hypothetical protein